MFFVLVAFLSGIAGGIFTGLFPAVHLNLLAVLLASFLSGFDVLYAVIFLSSMAITHTFFDFVPSILLGAPDEDTGLGVLPGHKFLLEGRAHEAVFLSAVGSFLSVVLLIVVVPIFLLAIPFFKDFLERMISWFLIWISFFLIYGERGRIFVSFAVFVLAGFLGIGVLEMNINQPLLPLLTGLFGGGMILNSLKHKTEIPEQRVARNKISKEELIKPALITSIVSPFCSFFPGLGSSQAAVISSKILKDSDDRKFLILLGSINTMVMAISFATLFLIGKSRTGIASLISDFGKMNSPMLFYIFASVFFAGVIDFFAVVRVSKFLCRRLHRVNYTKLSFFTLLLIALITFVFSGFLGLVVLGVSSLLGLFAVEVGVKKSFLMACLILPSIIFHLPF